LDIIIIAFFIVALFFIIGAFSSRHLSIRHFEIERKDMMGFKIVLLSDLHGRIIGDDNKKLIDAIILQKPDLVIMAGDMIDAYDGNAKSIINLVKNLHSKVDMVAVRGNHFYKACRNARNEMEDAFDKYGVTSLKNTRIVFHYKENIICIDGLDDPIASAEFKDNKKKDKLKRNRVIIKNAIDKMQDDKVCCDYRILVCHRPSYVDLIEKADYDLALSGHTHGGQWALPFGIEVLGDEAQFFPKKNMQSGLHYHNKMPLIITSGIGFSNVKLRTYMPPEIVTITFK